MPPTPPSLVDITHSTFTTALNLYPSLVEKVYSSKLKGNVKKVAEALERDRWRFEELPSSVARQRKGDGEGGGLKGLNKDEVERLVLWKM